MAYTVDNTETVPAGYSAQVVTDCCYAYLPLTVKAKAGKVVECPECGCRTEAIPVEG